MDITGEANGPPTKMGTSIADMVAGMMLSQGILAATIARNKTGRGQHVKVSMLEALASLLTYQAGNYYATGETPKRRGNAHPSIVPYETIEASDGWLNIGVANDSLWGKFCDAIGKPDWKMHSNYSEAPDRVRNREELMPLISGVIKTKNRKQKQRETRKRRMMLETMMDWVKTKSDFIAEPNSAPIVSCDW